MADLTLGELIDPSTHKRNGTAVKIATSDLTTHGVIVGMTGSGKTGLGVVLIEEVLNAGVPCILIDPKGDLTNLALTFPNLAPGDFQPWVNEGDAQKAGLSVPDFAAQQAKTWEDGLASWGIGKDRIQSLRDKTRFTIYTPGSNAGVPINIVGSLQAPASMDDMEIVNDEIEGFVSGLLGLVGIDADPLSSREHILLSNLISNSWLNGRTIDLPALVGQVMSPPIRKLGVFDLDQFYPPKDRTELAMKLNGLLASASFAAWAQGEPLDIGAMLRSPDGRPSAAIVTVAHLSDQERQFVVSMILSKLVTWMRRQSGTTDLRALLYMDEVAGYLPPTAMPPTKKPIMLLMKQARAFGVGVVLSTQNPVDIDYKAITNAGTWMVGRLQTEQDKSRLLDGMSAADGGVDISTISDTISGLGKREFVLRKSGKSTPDVFTSRWAMSYLRGPLTRDQIRTVVGTNRPVAVAPASANTGSEIAGAAAASVPALNDDQTPVMPEVHSAIPVRWIHPSAEWVHHYSANPNGTQYEAAALARARLRFDDEKAGIVQDTEWECVIYPLEQQLDATQNTAIDYDDRDLITDAPAGATYAIPSAAIANKTWWNDVQRSLADYLLRSQSITMYANRTLKMYSRAGESQADFAARCDRAASDAADTEAATLRNKYEAKAKTLQDQLDLNQQRLEAAKSAAHAKAAGAILSTAGSILGSFLGGRKSAGSILGKVVRGAGKGANTQSARQRADVVETKVAQLTQDLHDVEEELTTELSDITERWSDVAGQIDEVPISLERTDIEIVQLQLAWIPVR